MPTQNSKGQTRGHKKRARTRRRLLEAGLGLYASRGPQLKVLDITRAAEVSNGTFYNYFDGVEELIEAVVLDVMGALAEAVALGGSADPAERFAQASLRTLMAIYHHPQHAQVLLRLAAKPTGGEGLSVFLEQDLAEGHASGRFTAPPDALTVDVVFGTCLCTVRHIAAGQASPEQLQRVVVRLLEVLGVEPCEAAALVQDAATTLPSSP